jgi:arginase
MGPGALRSAGLAQALRRLGHRVRDAGDLPVPIAEAVGGEDRHGLVFVEPITQVCADLASRLSALPEGEFALTMGGDHSLAMGSVAGSAQGTRQGLIWIDAHTDFNTPATSPSGNVHGMPVAHLIGLGDPGLAGIGAWRLNPEDVVMIGIRSVDRGEQQLVRQHGVTVYTMREVDQLGITRIVGAALERLGGLPRLHVSLDADAIDPALAPGVGTPVPGGLTYREAHLLMELLCDSGRVTSFDIVEVNPSLDLRNQTAQLMVGLAQSLLGQRIL